MNIGLSAVSILVLYHQSIAVDFAMLLLTVLLQSSIVCAQSLLLALEAYPRLSSFRQLLLTNATTAGALLANSSITGSNSTDITRQTILVPSNDAFTNYQRANGRGIGSLSSSDLGSLVQYHSLQGILSSTELQRPEGLISETALTTERYNNRELGSNGAQQPQVVYISPGSTNNTVVVRQVGTAASANGLVRSGLGNEVNVEIVNGQFEGGIFQIVNGYAVLRDGENTTLTPINQLPHPPSKPNPHHERPKPHCHGPRPNPHQRYGRHQSRQRPNLRLSVRRRLRRVQRSRPKYRQPD